MGGQVEVGTGGHAPQLAPAEGEHELKVGGSVGVVAQLLGVMVAQAQIFVPDTQSQQPIMAELFPVGEPLQLSARLAEELQLHLLKLAGAEGEVARSDLIAEGLADLAHAEGQLPAGSPLDVLEVDKNTLGGLGAEVDGVLSVLSDPLEGLEHQVELADVRPVELAAGGAADVVLLHKGLHLRLAHSVHAVTQVEAVLLAPVLNDLVGAETLLALFTIHQGVGEAAHMAGGHPNLGIHQDGGVQTHIIGILLDELLPPGLLYVVFQFHTQRAVVPGVGQAAIDLRSGEDKSTSLTQSDDLFHGLFAVFHVPNSFLFRLFGSRYLPSHLGALNTKRPEPAVSAQGEQSCPWFHLNSCLADTHFVPGNGGEPAGHFLPALQRAFPPRPRRIRTGHPLSCAPAGDTVLCLCFE